MVVNARRMPSDQLHPGLPSIPWTVRSVLPPHQSFLFLDHCWVIWFTADLRCIPLVRFRAALNGTSV
jgi:hypothetical protein